MNSQRVKVASRVTPNQNGIVVEGTDITTIVRGPKPLAVLRELGLTPTHRAPEPNTWREVLATVDAKVNVAQQNVGLVEYGSPTPASWPALRPAVPTWRA